MVDHTLRLELLEKVQHTDFTELIKILQLIHAVQEAEVYIVRPQGFQLPVEGLLDGVKVPAPAVLAVFVIDGAEMALEENLFSFAPDRSAYGRIGGPGGAEVKEIDAMRHRLADNGLDLLRRRQADAAHAKTQNAEFFPLCSVGKFSVFHRYSSLFFGRFSSRRPFLVLLYHILSIHLALWEKFLICFCINKKSEF